MMVVVPLGWKSLSWLLGAWVMHCVLAASIAVKAARIARAVLSGADRGRSPGLSPRP